jgi:hypothetical protein
MSQMVGEATYKTFRFANDRQSEWQYLLTQLLQMLKEINEKVAACV